LELSEAERAICIHRLPFLTKLRERGSSIAGVSAEMWSNCVLNVALAQGPSRAQAEDLFELPDGIKLWHNDDSHYSIENGLFCEICKQSLSWPRVEGEL
jgi:hypothetical protein